MEKNHPNVEVNKEKEEGQGKGGGRRRRRSTRRRRGRGEIKSACKQALDDKDDEYPTEKCTKDETRLRREIPPGPGWTSITQPNDAGFDRRL